MIFHTSFKRIYIKQNKKIVTYKKKYRKHDKVETYFYVRKNGKANTKKK